MFRDLQKANTAFSGIAGHFLFGVNVAMAGQTPVNGRGVYVSGTYFPVLGLRPALGRLLTPSDDQTIGGNYVAVLSYAFWETQLGADPNVVGKQITINGQQMTIIGVAPKGFTGTTLGARPYVFVPITHARRDEPGLDGFRPPQQLLGLSVRATQAGRDDRAGDELGQHRLPLDHQRRRGAASGRG